MFDTIAGLPLHPLVVHAVIVLLPLACLGAVLVAIKPAWNRKYGWLVLACTVVATGSAFVAKESGEKLASRVGWPEDHIEWGERIPLASLVLLVLVAVLWWLDRSHPEARTGLAKAVAVLSVLAAAACLALAILAGHSGATAVWQPIVDNTEVGTVPEPGED